VIKRSHTMSGHRDFAGLVPEHWRIRSLGVAITGGALSLALVILQIRDFSKHSVGLKCVARCYQWGTGWESQLRTQLSEDRVLESNMLLVVAQQGIK
jgi:hypothetical protein